MIRQSRILDYASITCATVFGVGSVVVLVAGGASGYTAFGWSESTILVWDSVLSLVFFVQHSGMVRRSFQERLSTIIVPEYHRAIYATASGVGLALVVILWQRSEVSLWVIEGSARVFLRACAFAAILVFALSAYALRTFDPLGIGPLRAHLRNVRYQPGPFAVRGPYRWVRHPLYSCVLVLFWTNPDLTSDRVLFNILWTAWIYIGTRLEERDLVHEFGDRYTIYQKHVPMLIPWRGPVGKTVLNA